MKALTKQWIGLAEESFAATELLNRMRCKLRPNLLWFHCRESSRKYFIALLEENRLPINSVRNLLPLALPLIPRKARHYSTRVKLREFSRFDDRFLYPGFIATRAEARAALKACRSIRAEVRLSLGLSKK